MPKSRYETPHVHKTLIYLGVLPKLHLFKKKKKGINCCLGCKGFPHLFFQMMERIQECSSLQEQRDQYMAHLQQYSTGYQQLVSEREQLHKQFLQQTQLMDRLQHDEVQGKAQLEQSQLQLQQAQVRHASALEYSLVII